MDKDDQELSPHPRSSASIRGSISPPLLCVLRASAVNILPRGARSRAPNAPVENFFTRPTKILSRRRAIVSSLVSKRRALRAHHTRTQFPTTPSKNR